MQAGQAQQAAQGAARALLASKRAEIEAADMLEKTKNPKDADPAAAELLKVCLLLYPYTLTAGSHPDSLSASRTLLSFLLSPAADTGCVWLCCTHGMCVH